MGKSTSNAKVGQFEIDFGNGQVARAELYQAFTGKPITDMSPDELGCYLQEQVVKGELQHVGFLSEGTFFDLQRASENEKFRDQIGPEKMSILNPYVEIVKALKGS